MKNIVFLNFFPSNKKSLFQKIKMGILNSNFDEIINTNNKK